MKCSPSPILPEVLIVELDVHGDRRGYFVETYRAEVYAQHGIPTNFVQDNLSFSQQGVLRGLHYQLGRPQGKLVWVLQGEVFDVAVDIRRGAPTFGRWAGMTLSSEDYRQVYIPQGFAHGFCVLSETALFAYKCTDYYVPEQERGIRWDDPSLAIDWPVAEPIVSDKDRAYPTLEDVPEGDLPVLEGGQG